MKYFYIALLIAVSVGALAGCRPAVNDKPPAPPAYTTTDFQKLRWLEGSWRGTDAGSNPFYEKYHFANDTTIEIEFFADAGFTGPTKKESIVLADGQIRYGNAAIASRLDDKSIDFAVKDFPFSWEQRSIDIWIATLYRSTADGRKPAKAYTMERVKADNDLLSNRPRPSP